MRRALEPIISAMDNIKQKAKERAGTTSPVNPFDVAAKCGDPAKFPKPSHFSG